MLNQDGHDIVEKIKDRLDIVDVVSKELVLKKKGHNYWGLCPFHKEKSPSFSVNQEKGIYKCFGCGEGGDVISFLMKTQNKTFGEVMKDQATTLGIELPQKFGDSKDKTDLKKQILSALKDAAEFYMNNLYDENGKKSLSYLSARGINDAVIKEYQLGYAPQTDDFYKKYKEKYTEDVLEQAGLILKKQNEKGYIDRFKNRIIIPIFDDNGAIVAFGARAVEPEQQPKYLNSSDSLVYNKSKTLYGLYHAKESIKENDYVVVMEGYFDVISAQANGIKNCVASCGTSLTKGHIGLMSRYTRSRRIFLAFDSDSAGIKATERGAEVIKEAFMGLGEIRQFDEVQTSASEDKYSCEIRVVKPPEGKDPDEFIRTNGGETYRKHVEDAPLLLDFELEQVYSQYKKGMPVNDKLKLLKLTIPILCNIQNDIARGEYIKTVAQNLDVEEISLRNEVAKSFKYEPRGEQKSTQIVKKSINSHSKPQKNLLSVYLINESPLSPQEISQFLEVVEFEDESLSYIKCTIDKLTGGMNNVEDLIQGLYNTFAEDNGIKNIITDLIESAKPFEGLSDKDLRAVIEENIAHMNKQKIRLEKAQLRETYNKIEDDDVQAVQIQIQLKEKLKNMLKSGDTK